MSWFFAQIMKYGHNFCKRRHHDEDKSKAGDREKSKDGDGDGIPVGERDPHPCYSPTVPVTGSHGYVHGAHGQCKT